MAKAVESCRIGNKKMRILKQSNANYLERANLFSDY